MININITAGENISTQPIKLVNYRVSLIIIN